MINILIYASKEMKIKVTNLNCVGVENIIIKKIFHIAYFYGKRISSLNATFIDNKFESYGDALLFANLIINYDITECIFWDQTPHFGTSLLVIFNLLV